MCIADFEGRNDNSDEQKCPSDEISFDTKKLNSLQKKKTVVDFF